MLVNLIKSAASRPVNLIHSSIHWSKILAEILYFKTYVFLIIHEVLHESLLANESSRERNMSSLCCLAAFTLL